MKTLFLWLDWQFKGIIFNLQNNRGWVPEQHCSPLTGCHRIINRATINIWITKSKTKGCSLTYMWIWILGGHYVRYRHGEKTPQATIITMKFNTALYKPTTKNLPNTSPNGTFPKTHWPHTGYYSKLFSQHLDKQRALYHALWEVRFSNTGSHNNSMFMF